ncbi:hypothetical protein [Flavobacterium hydatis]|jgi:hypothetical protein|uniref:Uncharacterized protein n=1 Tax=Flavobacterium hydatis TaxID=991 RepID=A0A086AL01_FLAHY|nr:hypothetical protein [Flavobacterium hydatis]KFF17365.1 hypothetical protein IW20_08475 [Flavobacterium hydatis]OXA97337.1 hypothetical protein B0A62_03555 [Flavobacterium hydatis]
MIKDIISINTGVVFLKFKQDNELTIDDVTTLQVVNSGFVTVFVNDFELASKERLTIVPPDGTTSKVELTIRFARVDTSPSIEYSRERTITSDFSMFTWNKKEIDIIYKKYIRCKH